MDGPVGYLTNSDISRLQAGYLPLALGVAELFDRATILVLKIEHCDDSRRRTSLLNDLRDIINCLGVRNLLREPPYAWKSMSLGGAETEVERLQQVNRALWETEDAIRLLDAEVFTDTLRPGAILSASHVKYMQLARTVYTLNAERTAAKAAIGKIFGEKPEFKSYAGEETIHPVAP